MIESQPDATPSRHNGATWLTGLALLVLAWQPVTALLTHSISLGITVPIIANMAVSAAMLMIAVRSDRCSLALMMAFSWNFVFMGMAPAIQIASNSFPWLGNFTPHLISQAAWISLSGSVTLVVVAWFPALKLGTSLSMPHVVGRLSTTSRESEIWLTRLEYAQFAATAGLVAILGTGALSGGRARFKLSLLAASGTPGIGTAFFLSAALGIIVPAAAIWLQRTYKIGSITMMRLSIAAGFLATNPLIGSRFLTGSFIVAVVGAMIAGRNAVRFFPVGTMVGLTTVFPSLDLWRGDGLGSKSVAIQAPSLTLLKGDFDAFEMLIRAVSVHEDSVLPQADPVRQMGGALLNWIPSLSKSFPDASSGTFVARSTGMGFTNVSMPVSGEGYLIAGFIGCVVANVLLGLWLRWLRLAQSTRGGSVADASTAGLLAIILRGSLFSVLDYLLLAVLVGLLLRSRRYSIVPIENASAKGNRGYVHIT